MVIFNDLRINDDKDKIFVDCYIGDLSAYDNMYIKSIYIYHYSNASTVDGMPINMEKAYLLFDNRENSDTSVRAVSTIFTIDDTYTVEGFGVNKFDGEIFYVMVLCDGELGDVSSYVETAAESIDIGIILDWDKLYQLGMSYVSSFGPGNICNFPQGYDLFLLFWFGLKMALEIKDYNQIHKLWDKFLRTIAYGSPSALTTGCGCN